MKRRSMARRRVVAGFGVLLCSALFVGCDSRELTAPRPEVPATRRSAADEGVVLGTAFMSPPENTGPKLNLPYYELGIAVPESTWVVVHVSGGLDLRWNPECGKQPPYWQCMDNSPTGSYGESPGFGGPVQLFKVENGGGTAVRLRGSGGEGTSPASAVGILYQRRPGPLVGHLSMTAVYAPGPNGGSVPSWLVSGGYTVTATKVSAPFTVTESAPEPDGTVTYTAEPLPGLRFSNHPNQSTWPPGATFWAFYPGESLPDEPDVGWPGWQVTACQFQLVCRYKPPGPGRMQVRASVEWQGAIARSRPAGPQCSVNADFAVAATCLPEEPKEALKLTCDKTTPERGEEITCTAAAEPAGATLEVTE